MANYSTNLADWGAAGSPPPSGYAYQENEAPVDDFDNHVASNTIGDIKHLISLTNKRVESDGQDTAPTPESSHIWHDTSSGRLKYYDNTANQWQQVAESGELHSRYTDSEAQSAVTTFGGSHDSLSNVSASDHHSKYTDSDARNAVNTFGGNHDNLSGVSSSDHHSKYTNSNARSAVESGNLSQIDGQNSHRISFDQSSSYVEINDQNNNRSDLVAQDVYVNEDSTWLGDHIGDYNAHHSKYTDSEASSAAPVQSVNGSTGAVSINDSNTQLSDYQVEDALEYGDIYGPLDIHDNLRVDSLNGQSVDFHSRYSDSEARSAVSTFGGNHDNLSGVSSSDHHSRYSDSEASSAAPVQSVNGSTGAVSINDSDTSNHDNLSGVSSSDHHSKYTDSDAQSAVHNKYTDSDAQSACNGSIDADSVDGYDVTVNGSGGSGTINFNT